MWLCHVACSSHGEDGDQQEEERKEERLEEEEEEAKRVLGNVNVIRRGGSLVKNITCFHLVS